MDMLLMGLLGGIGALMLGQALLLWRATRSLRRLDVIEARVAQFGDALGLLTDTTESAFRAVAAEMARGPQASRPARVITQARTSRVARAARGGRTVTEIAAAEEMAEGEVSLRLSLANDAAPAAAPKARTKQKAAPRARQGGKRGTLRVG